MARFIIFMGPMQVDTKPSFSKPGNAKNPPVFKYVVYPISFQLRVGLKNKRPCEKFQIYIWFLEIILKSNKTMKVRN